MGRVNFCFGKPANIISSLAESREVDKRGLAREWVKWYNLPMLKHSTTVSQYKLPIRIEPQDEGGYVVTCPIWPDCYAQGETIDEAVLEIIAVAQSLIELSKEEGLNIPLKLEIEKKINHIPLSVPIIVTV